MATGCSWADLSSELLVSIATAANNGLSLRDYKCLRGVCTAWRSALASPYPCLLSIAGHRASVFSFPMRHSFHLFAGAYSTLGEKRCHMSICNGIRVVGSGNGRLAVANDRTENTLSPWTESIFLNGPSPGEEVEILPPGGQGREYVRKIVFAPNPNDGTVVAIYGPKKVAYIDTSNSLVMEDMEWTVVDVVSANTDQYLVDLVFDDAGDGKVYCLDSRGGVRVLQIPRGGRSKQDEPSHTLLSIRGAAALAPPYNIASTKHLFFCNGNMYQVWQNTSATIRSGNGVTMSADEIFVLRYNPEPYCWDAVKDLEGYSVLVGKNSSPAVVRAGAVHGVQANCIYWIDCRGVPMVCEVATGTSKKCVLPYGAAKGSCWYSDVDNMTSMEPSTAGQIKQPAHTSAADCGKETRPARSPLPKRPRSALE